MKLIIAGMATTILACSASAGSAVTVLVQDDGTTGTGTIGEFTGQTDSSPLGLGYLSSGTYVYIEDITTGPAAGALISFDRDLVNAARFSILLTPANAQTVTGASAIVDLECLAVDPPTDDIYVLVREPVSGALYIIRIPSLGLGTDTFGAPVVFADTVGMPNYIGGNAPAMTIDTTTSPRSVLFTRDQTSPNDDNGGNGIYRRSFSLAPTDPSVQLMTFVQLSTGTTPLTPNGSAMGYRSLAVIKAGPQAGNIVTNNSVGTGSANGDNVIWNVTSSTASIFVEALGTGRTPILSCNNGDIVMWAATAASEDLIRYISDSGTGVVRHVVATDAQLTAAGPSIPANLAEQAVGIATNGISTFGIFSSADNRETLFEIVDPTVPVELSVFSAN